MLPLVEPHRVDFVDYDRWARRVSLGDAAFRSEEALREAAFAPLRERPNVLAAWLERRGPDAHLLARPASAPRPPDDGWVPMRVRELGQIEARIATLRLGDTERRCLLVRRSAPAPEGATLVVTLAFPLSS